MSSSVRRFVSPTFLSRHGLLIAKWAVFVGLAAASVLLRLYRLDELPHGISQDAGAHGIDALRVLGGDHAVFFTTNFGREGMVVYGVALATAVFGRTVMSIYLPTALASVGTVFATWWMGQTLFQSQQSPWRAFVIGSAAAALTAVSLSQTFIGRAGVRANFLPLFLALSFALLWSGWRHRSLWRLGLAGACVGLLPYTYIPARLVPFLFVLWGLTFLPSLVKACRHYPGNILHHPMARPYARMGSVFVACATVVAAPILIHFAIHPAHFFMRSDLVSVLNVQIHQGDPLGALVHNTWNHLLAFGFNGDWATRHNIPFTPMLTPIEASLFWMGVITSVRHIRQPEHRLLVLWLMVLLVPAVLARGMMPPPSFIRMTGVTPAVYVLIGVGLWQTFGLFIQAGRSLPRHVFAILRAHETKIVVATTVLTAALVLIRGINTHAAYFQVGAAHPRFQNEFNKAWSDAAHVLNTLPTKPGTAYLLPYEFDTNFGFEFLYQGDPPAHVFDARIPDLPNLIESALAESGNITDVKLVQFSRHTAHVKHLLDKHAQLISSDPYPRFTIHSYTDVAMDKPWAFHNRLESESVQYDGGIQLLGFALGESHTQLPTHPVPVQPDGRSLWVDLKWEIDPHLNTDYAVSLRLQDSQGNRVYQLDQWLLAGPLYSPTSKWAPRPSTTTTHILLDVPPHVPTGHYELRLIVYNTETQTPTVEVGTWEPEATLTELLLPEYVPISCNF